MAPQDMGAVMALLKVAPGTSRVHASRLAFERLTQLGISLPVIHHITFPDGSSRDDLVLQSGAPARLTACEAPDAFGGRGGGGGGGSGDAVELLLAL